MSSSVNCFVSFGFGFDGPGYGGGSAEEVSKFTTILNENGTYLVTHHLAFVGTLVDQDNHLEIDFVL